MYTFFWATLYMKAEVWRNNSWCVKTLNGIAELGGDLTSYLLQ